MEVCWWQNKKFKMVHTSIPARLIYVKKIWFLFWSFPRNSLFCLLVWIFVTFHISYIICPYMRLSVWFYSLSVGRSDERRLYSPKNLQKQWIGWIYCVEYDEGSNYWVLGSIGPIVPLLLVFNHVATDGHFSHL